MYYVLYANKEAALAAHEADKAATRTDWKCEVGAVKPVGKGFVAPFHREAASEAIEGFEVVYSGPFERPAEFWSGNDTKTNGYAWNA